MVTTRGGCSPRRHILFANTPYFYDEGVTVSSAYQHVRWCTVRVSISRHVTMASNGVMISVSTKIIRLSMERGSSHCHFAFPASSSAISIPPLASTCVWYLGAGWGYTPTIAPLGPFMGGTVWLGTSISLNVQVTLTLQIPGLTTSSSRCLSALERRFKTPSWWSSGCSGQRTYGCTVLTMRVLVREPFGTFLKTISPVRVPVLPGLRVKVGLPNVLHEDGVCRVIVPRKRHTYVVESGPRVGDHVPDDCGYIVAREGPCLGTGVEPLIAALHGLDPGRNGEWLFVLSKSRVLSLEFRSVLICPPELAPPGSPDAHGFDGQPMRRC